MNKLLSLCTLAFLASFALAQDDPVIPASAASRKYAAYRGQSTDPLYAVKKVKALIAKIKSDQEDNRYLPEKTYKSLTVQEKFSYCMLHGEDFSQNCSAMPEILDEQKKIFPYFPGPFGDEAIWSDRQRAFLDNNRTKVVKMLRETIAARQRVGINLKQAIVYVKANELIPDLISVYKRDRKDHDLLTVMMLLMQEGKYRPFMDSPTYKKLYADDANYQSNIAFNAANEKLIIDRANAFYKSRTK
jgi:hypothetical protein